MDTLITLEPDPDLPDWYFSPHTRLVSHRLGQRGFKVKLGMILLAGIAIAAQPDKNGCTLDYFILDAKSRGGVACSAILIDAHDSRIDVLLVEDGCKLRSDNISVADLMEGI